MFCVQSRTKTGLEELQNKQSDTLGWSLTKQ